MSPTETYSPSASVLPPGTSGFARSMRTVVWSRSPQVGTVDANGLYTAPQSVSAEQTIILTATSVVDPLESATAKITLKPGK